MVGGSKYAKGKKAIQDQGAQETQQMRAMDSLVKNTGQTQQYVQDNYITPPIEQAQLNLERDLNKDRNPELENKELVPQLVGLLKIAREKTGEAAEQASKTLGAGIQLLKKTKEIKLTPIWQEQITIFVSLVKQQNEEPENKEIAEQARMRAGVVAENHSMYLDLQNETNIPKEKIDKFMDKRAATETRIMDEGLAAGKSMDEIEKEQKEAREQELKEFLSEAKRDGYEITPELLDKMNIFIDIADHRSELHDAGAYIEASNAETYEQYTGVMEAAGLAFLIGSAALTMDALGEGEAEEAPGAEAAAQAQMMKDIEDMAREDQERANEANKLIADLMEQAEESGEETTVGGLKDDELKERLEEMGVEQDQTIKDAIEFTNKTMETVAAQQGRVDELKQNAVEGLEPSFHTDPREALEMNGIMKGGELTEFGQSVMPDILKASGGSFNNALDQIMDAIPIEGREEFMEKVDEARLTINEYLSDPGNAENQREAVEILTNPEFVAVRAAFEEALADNAAEVIGKLNAA
jgi:hypothetical protein